MLETILIGRRRPYRVARLFPIMEPLQSPQPTSSWSFTTILHYIVIGLLILGGLAYWYLKPANPMADPEAARALAIVQTHRAAQAPTVLQALDNRVKVMKDRGQGVRRGEWVVEHQEGEVYLVRVWVREEGTKQWFEREYIWQVHLGKGLVRPLSSAAEDLMPWELRPPNPLVP